MSNCDSIGSLKARFEKQSSDSSDVTTTTNSTNKNEATTQKKHISSPSIARKLSKFDGSSTPGGVGKSNSPKIGGGGGGGGGGSPKVVTRKQVKKLNTALAQKPESASSVSPIVGNKGKHGVKDGWINKATATTAGTSTVVEEEGGAASKERQAAGSALANVLQGGSPKETRKRLVSGGEKDVVVVSRRVKKSSESSNKQSNGRTKSMDVKQLSSVVDKRGFNDSINSSTTSEEECSLGRSSSWSDNDVCALQKPDVSSKNEEVCRLPWKHTKEKSDYHPTTKVRENNEIKAVGSNWKRKEKTISLTSDALVSPRHDRKPLPSPPARKSPSHLLSSPQHDTSKARSTSDLTKIGIYTKERENHGNRKLLPLKSPAREQDPSKRRSFNDLSDDPKPMAKPFPGGAKPLLGGAKPLPGGAKPPPGPAKKPPIRIKPALPSGSKPVLPSGTKPALPRGSKPGLPGGGKPAIAPGRPNVTGVGVIKKRPPPPPPAYSSKQTEQKVVASTTLIEKDSQSPNKDVSNKGVPNMGVSKKDISELDDTLTVSESHDLSHDLEDTLIKDNSETESDWFLVKESASTEKSATKSTKALPSLPGKAASNRSSASPESERKGNNLSPRSLHSNTKESSKPLPSLPKVGGGGDGAVGGGGGGGGESAGGDGGESAGNSGSFSSPESERKVKLSPHNSPSNTKKQLPSRTQSLSNKDSHDSILDSSSGGSGSDSTTPNRVSSLRSKFSSPSPPVSPSLLPASDRVGVEEPPKSPGLRTGGSPLPLPPPGSPLIRVTPGSYSGPKLGGGSNYRQGSPQEGQKTSSNRGNVDSGFISEAPDDLNFVRGVSMDSLPGSSVSDDRGGVVSPSLPLSPGVEENEVEPEPEVWDEARIEKARNKRLNIATELLETEKTYSSRIKVVAVDFYDVIKQYNLKSKHCIPDSAILQIFLNIIQIHQLSENILLELQERMNKWSSHEALGDVICRLAPFLKLYATFTAGFEDAIKTLTEWTKKDRKFDAVVRDFERTSISTGLGLASFMLEPVQRIPRYRLLLRDYLKYLPLDSSDRADTESALRIISEAADHSNDIIKELENSNEILSIQRSLVDYEGMLLAPSRSFIMGGPLLKSSRKTLTQRYFFLFSDVLLHTYPPEKEIYKFRNEMPIFGMNVEDPKASLTPFSINIYSTTRSLILVASSEEEKQRWINALQFVICQDMKKRSSLRRDTHLQINRANNLFGTKPPIMVPDKSVTMCQSCSAEFTFTFRRHHCRACGKVVCGGCSQQKCYLPYLSKMERVCEPCYAESKTPDRLSGDEGTDSPLSSPIGPRKSDPAVMTCSGVLNLRAYEEDAVIAGYVLSQEGRKWNRMWYQIKKDCVLYKFKAHEDIKAINSMPLPGYAVGSDKNQHTITLNHHSGMKNLCDTFKVDDQTAFDNWQEAIRKVIRMEFDSFGVQPVTSPLAHDSRYFNDSSEPPAPSPSSSRPLSLQSLDVPSSPRTDSFSTVSSGSRPPSEREPSPAVGGGGDILESSESLP